MSICFTAKEDVLLSNLKLVRELETKSPPPRFNLSHKLASFFAELLQCVVSVDYFVAAGDLCLI